jgi:DDE superfamily endonuclease
MRHGPEHSQPVDARALARAAGGAAHPRGGADSRAGRAGAAARRVGGRRGDGGRPAGGGPSSRGCGSRGRAGLPPCAHEGTERRLVRPHDPVAQTDGESGKNKAHTGNNVLRVHALLLIRFLSDTDGGRVHDQPLADATPYPWPAGSRWLQELGFLAFTLPPVESLRPMKTPRGQDLTLEQQRANQALHHRRRRIEQVQSSVKRGRVVKDRIRLWKDGVRDLVMARCCALHNFRVRLTPWQPMV